LDNYGGELKIMAIIMKYQLRIKYQFFRKPVSEIDNKYQISVSLVKCGIGTGLVYMIVQLVSVLIY